MPDSSASAFEQAVRADGADSVRISCHVQPRASRRGIAGMFGSSLKVALNTPPVDGKANAALCEFLAEISGVPKSAVKLVSGPASREKTVRISGVSRDDVLRVLKEM